MVTLPQAASCRPDPAILALSDIIADPVEAARFPAHILRYRNDRAAAEVGLADLSEAEWIAAMGRFEPLPGNLPRPLALRYHGHQFRTYNPDLGDGRGFLYAQLRDRDGRLMDLGTKGSGTTPWSRSGDGRLTLKGAVREILATEALEALGVPTSRTLSVIETGEALERNDEPSPTRAAVLVRLSHSHIRFGTFQRLAYLDDAAGLERLVAYCLAQFGDLPPEAGPPPVRLLRLVVARMAELAAAYMVAGFVHGVLNTDNMNITGESFDYGPWRFAPRWQPYFTAAYFDHNGLYCFGRQPEAIGWNCGQLAAALRPLSEAEPLVEALQGFGPAYLEALRRRFCARLGVVQGDEESDAAITRAAEAVMAEPVEGASAIDRFFLDWQGGTPPSGVVLSEAGAVLAGVLRGRAAVPPPGRKPGRGVLIEEVEAIWQAIADRDDWQPLEGAIADLRSGNLPQGGETAT